MIFYFMDTGTYGLLGRHSVVVRHKYYLFAPPPKSLILRCFPLFCGVSQSKSIFLILPNVHRRSGRSVKISAGNRSQKINCAITIDTDSAKAIIGSSFSGNVGKLKSTIQSVCAHFLSKIIILTSLILLTINSSLISKWEFLIWRVTTIIWLGCSMHWLVLSRSCLITHIRAGLIHRY